MNDNATGGLTEDTEFKTVSVGGTLIIPGNS